MKDTQETRQAIIDGCLWLNKVGVNQGTSGNISVRVGADMLITPSATPYEAMTPDMIVRMPLNGVPSAQQNPSTEWQFHQAALNARPDMVAVVHAHPVHATAIAMQRRAIPPAHYMVAAFGGADVPCAGYARFGTAELSAYVVEALRDRHGCLMANHGALTLGESLPRALWRMQELETLAQMVLLSERSGTPVLLTDEDIAQTLAAFEGYGAKT